MAIRCSFRAFLFGCTVAFGIGAYAQGTYKGSLFLHWGYNRAWYSWSDIHFNGPDYDFTLRHVVAKDRPEPFGKSYFVIKNIWVPQYNYRAGWYFRERWSLSLGLDHMKYVVQDGQTVRMDGYVNGSRSIRYTSSEGSREVVLEKSFLQYEHTDGLNLLSVDLDHYDPLWSSASGKLTLRAYEGVHAGPVIPRTDVRLFGTGINNRFNVAGVGVGAQVGFQLDFLRHFYMRNAIKAGWLDLPRVLTTGNDEDHASQQFWFVQHAIVFGGRINLRRASSTPPTSADR